MEKSDINPITFKNIGLIMSTHYEIIELCLNSLPNKMLIECAKVCTSWKHVAEILLKKRNKFSVSYACNTGTTDENPSKVLVEQVIKSSTDVIGAKIFFCMSFINSTLTRGYNKCMSSDDYRFTGKDVNGVHKLMEAALPPYCGIISVVTDGIIGCLTESNVLPQADRHVRWKIQRPKRAALSTICFPYNFGTSAHLFHVDTENHLNVYVNGEYKTADYSLKGLLPGSVKCIILFAGLEQFHETDMEERFFMKIKKCQPEPFALAGCVSESTSISKHEEDSESLFGGIMFCGENLLSASMVLTMNDTEPDQIKEKVLQLKSCNFPLKNSILFSFSCVGRRNLKGEHQIIQRHFPDTPVVGLIGNGEFGSTYLPKFDNNKLNIIKNSERRAPDIKHTYGTMLILLSWVDKSIDIKL